MNKLFFYCLFFGCIAVFTAHAQADTSWYDNAGNKVPGWDYADYYKTARKLPDGRYEIKEYSSNNRIRSAGIYTSADSGVRDGVYTHYNKRGVKDLEGSYEKGKPVGVHKSYYDTSGSLWITETYSNGLLNGDMLVYYPGGKLRRKELYKDDRSVSGKCYDEQGGEVAFFPMSTLPMAEDGKTTILDYLVKNVQYPDTAREAGIQGVVRMKIKIDKRGVIQELRCLSTPDQSLADAMAAVVMSMKNIKPATYDGQPVEMSVVVPFTFRLE